MLAGHKTSVSLEDAFWQGLKEIATRRKLSGSALIATIDAQRGEGNLSSAIRLFVLDYFRNLAEPAAAASNIREEQTAMRDVSVVGPTYHDSDAVRPPGFRRWA